MSRSLKKGPFIDEKLLKKLRKIRPEEKIIIKTWSRGSIIIPEMIGYTIGVHNGKDFIPVYIIEDMIGHRLGEFALTKKFIKHGGKMQRDIEKGQETAGVAPVLKPKK